MKGLLPGALLLAAAAASAAADGVLEGRLLDDAGNPVAGGAVLVLPAKEGEEEPPAEFRPPATPRPGDPGDRVPVGERTKVRADADGRFRVEGLEEDREHWVLASLEGMEEAWTRARPGAAGLVLRVPGPREILGVCVDGETGRPVPNLAVWVGGDHPRGSVSLQKEPADAEGRFRIRGLLAGKYRVWIGHTPEPFGERKEDRYERNYLDRWLEGVPAGGPEMTIRVTRGLAIEGRLVDDAGNAVAGVTVEPVRQSATGGEYFGGRGESVVSGSEGRFRLGGLAPGLFGLKIGSASDHGGTIRSFHEMDRDEGKAEPAELAANRRVVGRTVDRVPAGSRDLVVRLVRDVRIRGSLVDAEGAAFRPGGETPLYVCVAAGDFEGASHGHEAKVREDGTFETGPLDPGGTYDLCLFLGGGRGSGAARGVKPGTRGVRIRVTPGRDVSGRVTDEDGTPVGPGVPVESLATGHAEGSPGGFRRSVTGEDGAFVLEGLGEMSVLFFAGGGSSPYLRTQARGEYLPGESGVTLVARRGAILAGRILDEDGRPVRAGFVAAGAGPVFPVAEDGSFRIGGIPRGRARLTVWIGDAERDLGEFEAPSEAIEVRLSR